LQIHDLGCKKTAKMLKMLKIPCGNENLLSVDSKRVIMRLNINGEKINGKEFLRKSKNYSKTFLS
jgi:hypothetical protein